MTPTEAIDVQPTVWIVGAGPGAPDLLTLRALRALEQADVLVWTDSLVNPQIAALATSASEQIRTSTLTLEEVMALVVERALAGQRVVRLHDGDPCLYGALAEQICRLADAGIAAWVFTLAIPVVLVGLLIYARRMAANGVLR